MTSIERIIDAMPTGEGNGIALRDLINISGLNSERATRRMIELIRRSGTVICSNEQGYYYPANIDELRQYINTERRRAESISITLKSAERLLAEWSEQA